jgi:hypothetical protein
VTRQQIDELIAKGRSYHGMPSDPEEAGAVILGLIAALEESTARAALQRQAIEAARAHLTNDGAWPSASARESLFYKLGSTLDCTCREDGLRTIGEFCPVHRHNKWAHGPQCHGCAYKHGNPQPILVSTTCPVHGDKNRAKPMGGGRGDAL